MSPSDLPSSSPSPSLSIADVHVEEGIKNNSAAYNTQLIIQRVLANESPLAPNPYPENVPPLNPGLWTAPGVPMAEHPHPLMPEQEGLYVVDAAAQSASQSTVFDDVLDNFLAQFDDWLPVASSLPTPTVPYNVNDTLAPAPAPLPSYAIDDVVLPMPASLFPYAVAPCEHSPYATDTFWSGAPPSQPDSFATPDMGVYPQVVDQGYLYTACAGTSHFNFDFATPGLYVH